MDQALIDAALKQIQTDIEAKDLTAIEELLKAVPDELLKAFLSETT